MTAPAKTGSTSVLASLVAETMGEKQAAAKPKLTPVAGEARPLAPTAPHLPNDTGLFMSNETLHEHAKTLRKMAADFVAVADGIDEMVGGSYLGPSTEAPKVETADQQKQREFEADLLAKERAAQEAAFKSPVIEAAEAAAAEPDATPQSVMAAAMAAAEPEGWLCPVHERAIDKTSTKTGRVFRGCPDCNLFQR